MNLAVSKGRCQGRAYAKRLAGDVSWTPVSTGQDTGASTLGKASDGSLAFDEYGNKERQATFWREH